MVLEQAVECFIVTHEPPSSQSVVSTFAKPANVTATGGLQRRPAGPGALVFPGVANQVGRRRSPQSTQSDQAVPRSGFAGVPSSPGAVSIEKTLSPLSPPVKMELEQRLNRRPAGKGRQADSLSWLATYATTFSPPNLGRLCSRSRDSNLPRP